MTFSWRMSGVWPSLLTLDNQSYLLLHKELWGCHSHLTLYFYYSLYLFFFLNTWSKKINVYVGYSREEEIWGTQKGKKAESGKSNKRTNSHKMVYTCNSGLSGIFFMWPTKIATGNNWWPSTHFLLALGSVKPRRAKVRAEPTFPSSSLLPTSTYPKTHPMNFDESIACPWALITACTVKRYPGHHYNGKESAGHEPFSLSVQGTKECTKQLVLGPPLCPLRKRKSAGTKSSRLGSKGKHLRNKR